MIQFNFVTQHHTGMKSELIFLIDQKVKKIIVLAHAVLMVE